MWASVGCCCRCCVVGLRAAALLSFAGVLLMDHDLHHIDTTLQAFDRVQELAL